MKSMPHCLGFLIICKIVTNQPKLEIEVIHNCKPQWKTMHFEWIVIGHVLFGAIRMAIGQLFPLFIQKKTIL